MHDIVADRVVTLLCGVSPLGKMLQCRDGWLPVSGRYDAGGAKVLCVRHAILCCRVLLPILRSSVSSFPCRCSPLQSVMVSIQSLMDDRPYHNEPGFEKVIKC